MELLEYGVMTVDQRSILGYEGKMKKKAQIVVGLILLAMLAALTAWMVKEEQRYHPKNVESQKVLEQKNGAGIAEEKNVSGTGADQGRKWEEKSELEQAGESEQATETEQAAEAQEPYASPVDFDKLWETNPEVVGWLTIPGTRIDYPILQAEDNEKYLHTDLEGKKSSAGAIYMDFENESDFSDLHNVIYGHHMKNGTMFKDIVYFKQQDFLEEHRDIYIYTPEREIHLKAFAALYTTPDAIRRKVKFQSAEEFEEYAESMTAKTQAWIEPESKIGKLYSFITCSYEFTNARTILYAYEIIKEE